MVYFRIKVFFLRYCFSKLVLYSDCTRFQTLSTFGDFRRFVRTPMGHIRYLFFNKRKQRSGQHQKNIEKNLKSIWVDPMGPSSIGTSHPDPENVLISLVEKKNVDFPSSFSDILIVKQTIEQSRKIKQSRKKNLVLCVLTSLCAA